MFSQGKQISSGLFRYQFEWDSLKWILWEFLLIGGIVGLKGHSIGIGIFVFVALLLAMGFPLIALIINLVLSAGWGSLGIWLLRSIQKAGEVNPKDTNVFHPHFIWYDYAGVFLVVFLVSYGIHTYFTQFVQEAKEA